MDAEELAVAVDPDFGGVLGQNEVVAFEVGDHAQQQRKGHAGRLGFLSGELHVDLVVELRNDGSSGPGLVGHEELFVSEAGVRVGVGLAVEVELEVDSVGPNFSFDLNHLDLELIAWPIMGFGVWGMG